MTTDPTALTYVTAQWRQAADRARRNAAVCACGAEYQPTPDGRRAHRTLHGHTPCEPREGAE